MNFILSIAASVLASILYSLLVRHREEQIRSYLKTRRDGWARALYLKALIQAIRGEAQVSDSRHGALVLVFFLFGVSLGLHSWASDFENRSLNLRTQLNQVSNDFRSPPSIEEMKGRAAQQLKDLEERAAGLEPQVFWAVLIFKSTSYGILIASVGAWAFWMPYVLLRKRFSYEVTRFSLRIQGLANPEELVLLTAAELLVRDGKTLEEFVGVMKRVATRHGVPALTRTFELWETSDQSGPRAGEV